MVMPGAFRGSLGRDNKVRFLLAHDEKNCLGDTDDGLELCDAKEGLAFRFRFPDTPHGREIKELVASEEWTGMSIGFIFKLTSLRNIDGTEVTLIHSAFLQEISVLPIGLVSTAYAYFVPDDGQSLAADCKSHKIACDGAYVELRKACKQLRATMN